MKETTREELLKKIKDQRVKRIEDKIWTMIMEETRGSVCVLSEDAKALREIISEYIGG